ncbi:MAG: hypothetical protein ABIP08_04605 [Lautropia sp.]
MSRRSKLARWHRALIAAVTLVACGASGAEIVDSGKSAKTRPAPVESMARVPDNAPKSVLKCWQEGRLIFESSGVAMAEGAAGAPALMGANGRTVQLLDLRQGLCILERTNG